MPAPNDGCGPTSWDDDSHTTLGLGDDHASCSSSVDLLEPSPAQELVVRSPSAASVSAVMSPSTQTLNVLSQHDATGGGDLRYDFSQLVHDASATTDEQVKTTHRQVDTATQSSVTTNRQVDTATRPSITTDFQKTDRQGAQMEPSAITKQDDSSADRPVVTMNDDVDMAIHQTTDLPVGIVNQEDTSTKMDGPGVEIEQVDRKDPPLITTNPHVTNHGHVTNRTITDPPIVAAKKEETTMDQTAVATMNQPVDENSGSAIATNPQEDYKDWAMLPISLYQPGSLGIVIKRLNLSKQTHNLIKEVKAGSQAEAAGVMAGDILVASYDDALEWSRGPRPICFSVLRNPSSQPVQPGPRQLQPSHLQGSHMAAQGTSKSIVDNVPKVPSTSKKGASPADENASSARKKHVSKARNDGPQPKSPPKAVTRDCFACDDVVLNPAKNNDDNVDSEAQTVVTLAHKLATSILHPELNSSQIAPCPSSQNDMTVVPYCKACRKETSRTSSNRAHHALCPNHPNFESSGAREKLEFIRDGIKLGCEACKLHYQNGSVAHQGVAHTETCDKRKMTLRRNGHVRCAESKEETVPLVEKLLNVGQDGSTSKKDASTKKADLDSKLGAASNRDVFERNAAVEVTVTKPTARNKTATTSGTKKRKAGALRNQSSATVKTTKTRKIRSQRRKSQFNAIANLEPGKEQNQAIDIGWWNSIQETQVSNGRATKKRRYEYESDTDSEEDANRKQRKRNVSVKQNTSSCIGGIAEGIKSTVKGAEVPLVVETSRKIARLVTPLAPSALPTTAKKKTKPAESTASAMNLEATTSHTKPNWVPCTNPWGPSGYVEGDVVLTSLSGGFSHHETVYGGRRFVMSPFHSQSDYLITHRTPSEGFEVLQLTRDPMAKLPWGFTYRRHEFGGACLVSSVDPLSPAASAVYRGNESEQTPGLGLRLHDMILSINGKSIGGMTELGAGIELDICGQELELVISRYRDRIGAASQLVAKESCERKRFDHAIIDRSRLDWYEVNPHSGLEFDVVMPQEGDMTPLDFRCNLRDSFDFGTVGESQHQHSALGNSIMAAATEQEPMSPNKTRGLEQFSLSQLSLASPHSLVSYYESKESEKPTVEEIHSDQSHTETWTEDDNAWLDCVCGDSHPESVRVFWIQCDDCHSWYNVAPICVGFTKSEASSLGKWVCRACDDSVDGQESIGSNSAHSIALQEKPGGSGAIACQSKGEHGQLRFRNDPEGICVQRRNDKHMRYTSCPSSERNPADEKDADKKPLVSKRITDCDRTTDCSSPHLSNAASLPAKSSEKKDDRADGPDVLRDSEGRRKEDGCVLPVSDLKKNADSSEMITDCDRTTDCSSPHLCDAASLPAKSSEMEYDRADGPDGLRDHEGRRKEDRCVLPVSDLKKNAMITDSDKATDFSSPHLSNAASSPVKSSEKKVDRADGPDGLGDREGHRKEDGCVFPVSDLKKSADGSEIITDCDRTTVCSSPHLCDAAALPANSSKKKDDRADGPDGCRDREGRRREEGCVLPISDLKKTADSSEMITDCDRTTDCSSPHLSNAASLPAKFEADGADVADRPDGPDGLRDREGRSREDGCVLPVSELKNTADGMYVRPRGRVPRYTTWDPSRNLFAPKSKQKGTPKHNSSCGQTTNARAAKEPSEPPRPQKEQGNMSANKRRGLEQLSLSQPSLDSPRSLVSNQEAKKLEKPQIEETHSDQSHSETCSEDGNGCVCGETHPEPVRVFWIQCDDCDSWNNVAPICVGFTESEASSIGQWLCPSCDVAFLPAKPSQKKVGRDDVPREPKKNADNMYARPRGRAPRGTSWDKNQGIFVPESQSKGTTKQHSSSGRKIKARKVREASEAPRVQVDAQRGSKIPRRKPKLHSASRKSRFVSEPTESPTEKTSTSNLRNSEGAKRSRSTTKDGCVLPVSAPKKTTDNMYARPRGRAPRGTSWDANRGIFAPESQSKGTAKQHSSSGRKTKARKVREASEAPRVQVDAQRGSKIPRRKPKLRSASRKSRFVSEPTESPTEKTSTSNLRNSEGAKRTGGTTKDGCVLPGSAPKKTADNMYARPRGRAPRDTTWNPSRGVFVPIPKPKSERKAPSTGRSATRVLDEVNDSEHSPTDDTTGSSHQEPKLLAVGTLVSVDKRDWPGSNKLGGIGMIIDFRAAEDGTGTIYYDVSYSLGGKEKGIDWRYVSAYQFSGRRNAHPKEN